MAFPSALASILTGASPSQLANWRQHPALLVPEIQTSPRALYSFQDLVALRTFVHLRKEVPLQRIRKALAGLRELDLTEHPSRYQFTTDGESVFLVENGVAVDLVRKGQIVITSLENVYGPFINLQGHEVVDFQRPRPLLRVDVARLGGWPTIDGTRVAFDSVASLVEGGLPPERVANYYPRVGREAALDALSLQESINHVGEAA
ncbi:DUF433 domain-containing protein [Lentzea sp. NPDC034063]|uniref:DUF433 domain-containing protein n=1 Tax=unclassified Lentzea TaxID=2643253 RepID=UPI0029AEEA85|nr:DUF433 domain-containing protein [Streptomyces sp. ID05-26A]